MTTFEEYKYERPIIKDIKLNFDELLKAFKLAETYDKQNEIIGKINEVGSDFYTQSNLAYIRASIDTNDKFYRSGRKNPIPLG